MGRKRKCSEQKSVVIKSMADAGIPYREIQEIIPDVSLGTISKIVSEFEANRELTEWYRKNRADILAQDQRYRSYITDEKLMKASARDLELMRCMTYDKERLERGESTENVALIVETIREMKKQK